MAITQTELKNVKFLRTKKGRRETKLFAAEGVRLLEESLRCRFLPSAVYYASALLTERGVSLVERFRSECVPVRSISAKQMNSVADSRAPQGILGVFRVPRMSVAERHQPRFRRLLLCDSLSDPGNLGTLARSALAFGFDLMLLAGNSAEVYSPKVVRASAGALFGLKIATVGLPELFEFARSRRFKLLALAGTGHTDRRRLKSVVRSHRLIVAVGSEASGLSSEILEQCDLVWRIDHRSAVESLNAAVAGSIIMKEVFDAW